jgi:DNA-binding transcriptional ArsR family regulator
MSETVRDAPPDPSSGEVHTGWRVVADTPTVVELIDALLSLPPHREFNKSELAEMADVSRRSVHTHLDTLRQLGVLEEVENSSPQRFRFDRESEVAEALATLDAVVGQHGPVHE